MDVAGLALAAAVVTADLKNLAAWVSGMTGPVDLGDGGVDLDDVAVRVHLRERCSGPLGVAEMLAFRAGGGAGTAAAVAILPAWSLTRAEVDVLALEISLGHLAHDGGLTHATSMVCSPADRQLPFFLRRQKSPLTSGEVLDDLFGAADLVQSSSLVTIHVSPVSLPIHRCTHHSRSVR